MTHSVAIPPAIYSNTEKGNLMRIQFSIEPLQVVKNKLRQCLIDTAIYLFDQASRERYISQTGVTGGMSHLVTVILQAVIARHSQCETAKRE